MPHVLAQDLRVAVLQYAIQGKLTTQEITDSNVDDFLNCIKEQKSRLIKEKAVKKQPKSVLFDEEELPFEIPDNWRWVSLIDLGFFSSGKTPNMAVPEYWDNGTVNWTTSKDLKTKYILSSKMKITELAASEMTLYPAGTLVMSVRSGILKHTLPVCILKKSSTINQDLKAYQLYDLRLSDYVFYVLKGLEPIILQDYTKRVTTVDSLRFDEFSQELPIPLPPIEEQARIVARVDELMAKIDEYEKIEKELVKLQKDFPGNMKDAILQAAMQGKLTEQLESDGNASQLAKAISVKDKKWKPITEDEEPFSIPDTWTWMRLREFTSITAGGTPTRSEKRYWNGNIPWLKIGNMNGKYVDEADEFITEEGLNNSSAKWVEKGTILYSIFASIGTVSILNYPATTNQAIAAVKLNPSMNRDYMYYVLTGLKSVLVAQGHGMAQMNINQEILKNTPIPIPPVKEQQRIVEKLDQLLPLCDQLEQMAA